MKSIVERPKNLSFGQVKQDETKNFKIGACLVYRNWPNILQRVLPQNTKEIPVFQFLAFYFIFCSYEIFFYIDHFVWSIRFFWYPYQHIWWFVCHMTCVMKCHKTSFYDILWHMSYDINCHEVWQYGYQKIRIDQTIQHKHFKTIFETILVSKNQKK